MSRREMLDVVVVGAGVVGAAAALAFARDGLQVALVEAREPSAWRRDAPDLRVYAFAPDNAALLDDLGVWDDICATRAQPYRRMRVWDAGGGGELAFDADAFGRRELGWIVEHGLLVDRLWAALPAAGVQVHCPEDVVALEQDETSASVQLQGGRRLRARLVVAADGAQSRLRELAGITTREHDYAQRAVVGFIDTQLPHQDTCFQRFLPGGPLAFLPFADGRSSIVWTLPETEAQRLLQAEDEVFLRELSAAFAGTLGELRGVSTRAAFPLHRRLAQDHVAGRVVIVGDAAHVVHPLAGQGVNLGLRDVATLRAMLLRQLARNIDIASAQALRRWARQQRSDNARAALIFDGLNRLFSNDAMLATVLRGPMLGWVGRFPPLTHAFWREAAGL